MSRVQKVILDTDIGSDIDDTWALMYLLASPELDLVMIVVTGGDLDYRARLCAKLLETCGRTDIPIVRGVPGVTGPSRFQEPWLDDYSLDTYDGAILEDATDRIADMVRLHGSVTIIGIGTASTLAEFCHAYPDLVLTVRLVGMYGSIRVGYGDGAGPVSEANVYGNIDAFRTAIAAPWEDKLITPLDTCGNLVLDGDRYQQIRHSRSTAAGVIRENYDIWARLVNWIDVPPGMTEKKSSVLFDVVAVLLAFDESRLKVVRMPIWADDEGILRVDQSKGTEVRVALEWRDKAYLLDQLTERVTTGLVTPTGKEK
jgi:inosine-uridine nucleoside N-ribohydrolase